MLVLPRRSCVITRSQCAPDASRNPHWSSNNVERLGRGLYFLSSRERKARFQDFSDDPRCLPMPLRAMALLLSLVVHGLFGFALWPRPPIDELEPLDFGAGRDIE